MRRLLSRTTLVAATIVTLGLPVAAPILEAQTVDSGAQTPRTHHRTPRRLILALVGAGVGAGLAGMYWAIGDNRSSPGSCTSRECVGIIMLSAGALSGYMIGREFDQLHEIRYRGGAPLTPSSVTASLAGEPLYLAVRDSVVAVAGTAGVQVFTTGASSLHEAGRRGTGVRGMEAVDVTPGAHASAVGAPTGLYVYPPQTGPGVLLREGRTSAIAAVPDRVWFGVGSRIEGAPATADTTRGWPGIDLGRHVDALLWDDARSVLWTLADSTLVALRPAGDSLERVGALALGGPARRLSVSGDRLAIALGEGGVRLVDVSDVAAPRELARWTGARYVYDVSLAGSRLYVAAGVEGVYVLGASGSTLRTLGLARELGFATALASRNGYTYLIDRNANALRRISSSF